MIIKNSGSQGLRILDLIICFIFWIAATRLYFMFYNPDNFKNVMKFFIVTQVVAMAVLVCMSTMFIKQHSFTDFLAALPLGLLAEIMVFGKSYYWPKTHKAVDSAKL